MRYIIGIDLGTTNSCVSYVDTQHSNQIHAFHIPQLMEPGLLDHFLTLPSFCYLTKDNEWTPGSLDLPWSKNQDYFVGFSALQQGARIPSRLVQSAKSWLCHNGASRKDNILPLEANEDFLRISPVEATSRYLKHLRDAWNHKMKSHPEDECEQQEIILTVPASFDEVARALTIEAARKAGFSKMTLLEEPQAAFYSWISQHEKNWDRLLTLNSQVLVCDVGGGTTDFSLIDIVQKKEGLAFQRMAVGDHVLLGGDNMDAALAYYIESKLKQQGMQECTAQQWLQIKHQARSAKEALLGIHDSFRVQILGSGSSVVQGSLSIELTSTEVVELLTKGFFSECAWEEALMLKRGSALRSFGLPYAEEPSIIKHLAYFLHKSGGKPQWILFNGGAMKPQIFRKAIIKALEGWFPENKVRELDSYNMDLAVARGAAYYGRVRRGAGIKIGGGSARGYYLALEKDGMQQALTLLPKGTEEGDVYESAQTFYLMPNIPVAFQLYTSHVRLHDEQGTLVKYEPEEMLSLPPIQTVLKFGRGAADKIPVSLGIKLTAIGTLELWLKSKNTEHQWRLEFQLRNSEGQENSLDALMKARKDETYDASFMDLPKKLITEMLEGNIKPSKIMEKLETAFDKEKKVWAPSVLRGLWDYLLEHSSKRKHSQELECRWWNLLGFCLRPGYGYPLDDFRIKELWKIILTESKSRRPLEIQFQQWICYRRIAGGLSKGQQLQLAHELLAGFWSLDYSKDKYHYQEKVRTLASFEFLEIPIKKKLGEHLLARLKEGHLQHVFFWALGRLGARQLVYGSLGNIVPKEICQQWIEQLLSIGSHKEPLAFTIAQLARKTDHRELNFPHPFLEGILKHYSDSPFLERLKALLFNNERLTEEEKDQIFGEQLPLGLSLEN